MVTRAAHNPFVRNVILLAGGTLLGQVILIATSPILTRLYTPDDLGMLSLYLTFVNVFATVVMLRYEGAIVSADHDREAAHLLWGGMLLGVAVSPVLALILWGMIRAQVLGFGQLSEWAALLVLPSLIFTALFTALRYWLIRQQQFGVVTSVTVVQNVARAVAQIGLGLLSLSWLGLITGEIVGRGSGVLRMTRASWAALRIHPVEWAYLRATLSKYRKFPLYSAPSSLIDTLGNYIAVPLLTTFYGLEATGYYSLVLRLIAVPGALIGGSVGDAFHKRMSDYRQQPEQARRFFLRTAGGLLLLSLAPALGLILLAQPLFEIIFGAAWRTAGEMAAVMSVWMVSQIVVAPLTRVVFIYNGQEKKLVYDMLSLVTSTLVFPISSAAGYTATQAVALLSAGNVLTYVVYFVLLWQMLPPPES